MFIVLNDDGRPEKTISDQAMRMHVRGAVWCAQHQRRVLADFEVDALGSRAAMTELVALQLWTPLDEGGGYRMLTTQDLRDEGSVE